MDQKVATALDMDLSPYQVFTERFRNGEVRAVGLVRNAGRLEAAQHPVVVGVIADDVSAANDLPNQVRVLACPAADDEEGRFDFGLVQMVEDPRRRFRPWPVVERERNHAVEPVRSIEAG